jgi:hypothetical protein
MTSRPPDQRAKDLTRFIGVQGRFDLAYFVHTSNRFDAEEYVHRKLDRFPMRPWEEFFEVSLPLAVDGLDEAARHWPLWWSMPGQLQRKQDPGVLPQAFRQGEYECPHCGKKNYVRELAIQVRHLCRRCGRALE